MLKKVTKINIKKRFIILSDFLLSIIKIINKIIKLPILYVDIDFFY